MNPTQFGAQLRAAREAAGLSRADAAARTGLHMLVIGTYERGDRACAARHLPTLANAYGITPAELLGEHAPAPKRGHVVLNLTVLTRTGQAAGVATLARWAHRIRTERDDWGGKVLTIRDGDMATLGLLYDLPPDVLLAMFAAWGVLAPQSAGYGVAR